MSNQSRAEYMREYRKKNAERLRPQQAEYKRKWRAENRDKEKEYNHKQYLRRKGGSVGCNLELTNRETE